MEPLGTSKVGIGSPQGSMYPYSTVEARKLEHH